MNDHLLINQKKKIKIDLKPRKIDGKDCALLVSILKFRDFIAITFNKDLIITLHLT